MREGKKKKIKLILLSLLTCVILKILVKVDEERTCKPCIIFIEFSRFPVLIGIGKQRYFCFLADAASEPFVCIYCKKERSTEPEGFLWMWKESGRQ